MDQKENIGKQLFWERFKFKMAIFGGILIIILLIVVFFVGKNYGKHAGEEGFIKSSNKITETILQQQMEKVGELGTVKYYYTNMGKYANAKEINGVSIPFTNKSFIISYDGIIKAGIDLQDVSIQLEKKKIKVLLPKAKILSHEILKDSVAVYDEKNSIFNGLSISDVTAFEQSQNKLMEEKANQNGVLDEANENAKSTLKNIFQVFLLENKEDSYSIEFQAKE